MDLLESHLNSNESTFAKLPEFSDYYGRNGSPVKREKSSPEPFITKTTRRRTLNKDPSYVKLGYATRDALRLTNAQTRVHPHHYTRNPQRCRAYTQAEIRLSTCFRDGR